MGFLDNSGDIILDAVLTDTGRFRLAKGDGSFKISKFALADDEIDYGLYDKTHTSGTAYYDLQVLQTPVFEAITNNTSTMHSKLMTVASTNLLYLPVMEINTEREGDATRFYGNNGLGTVRNTFVVCADNETYDIFATLKGVAGSKKGLLRGATPAAGGDALEKRFIRIDQGLDTAEISPSFTLDAELYESQYIIEMDNRLGYICQNGDNVASAGAAATVNFIDDDNITSYYLSEGVNSNYVKPNTVKQSIAQQPAQVISGPRGSILQFGIKATHQLQNSYYLFQTLGGTTSAAACSDVYGINDPDSGQVYHIDTMIRVTGARTGYRLDIPVRFIRHSAT